jgi:hypothetical protein
MKNCQQDYSWSLALNLNMQPPEQDSRVIKIRLQRSVIDGKLSWEKKRYNKTEGVK